jgi:hypothetical protein
MEDIQGKINVYNKKIIDALSELHDKLPTAELRGNLLSIAKMIGERDCAFGEFIRHTMSGLHTHAGNVQSFLNYMSFDLEATRRERDKYLKQLRGDEDA